MLPVEAFRVFPSPSFFSNPPPPAAPQLTELGKKVINTLTVLKVILVVFLILAGLVPALIYGAPSYPNVFADYDTFFPQGAGGTISGASLLFFGFIGFDEVCCMAARSENPAVVMPRAIAGTLLGAGVMYVRATRAYLIDDLYEDELDLYEDELDLYEDELDLYSFLPCPLFTPSSPFSHICVALIYSPSRSLRRSALAQLSLSYLINYDTTDDNADGQSFEDAFESHGWITAKYVRERIEHISLASETRERI